jgi:hypothetical protein
MATTSFTAAIAAAAFCMLSGCATTNPNRGVVPPDARFDGKTYSEWAGASWKWALELPVDGHPFSTCDRDLSAGQSGKVWYWAAPFSCPAPIAATLAPGKALFLTLTDVETSSLEDPPFHGDTEQEQRANSKWLANHIVEVFCFIDGKPVRHLRAYRFSNPQIHFTAPTPWIYGSTGGPGTSVGDGYYLMLKPMPEGKHRIHYGGSFHFNAGELGPEPVDIVQDIIIDLTVGQVTKG